MSTKEKKSHDSRFWTEGLAFLLWVVFVLVAVFKGDVVRKAIDDWEDDVMSSMFVEFHLADGSGPVHVAPEHVVYVKEWRCKDTSGKEPVDKVDTWIQLTAGQWVVVLEPRELVLSMLEDGSVEIEEHFVPCPRGCSHSMVEHAVECLPEDAPYTSRTYCMVDGCDCTSYER